MFNIRVQGEQQWLPWGDQELAEQQNKNVFQRNVRQYVFVEIKHERISETNWNQGFSSLSLASSLEIFSRRSTFCFLSSPISISFSLDLP